jgi:hypothetical protein
MRGRSSCAHDFQVGQGPLNTPQAARIYREAFDFGHGIGIANPQILVTELREAP